MNRKKATNSIPTGGEEGGRKRGNAVSYLKVFQDTPTGGREKEHEGHKESHRRGRGISFSILNEPRKKDGGKEGVALKKRKFWLSSLLKTVVDKKGDRDQAYRKSDIWS